MDQLSENAGKSFGRFQLLLEMSRGGMATLFLARLKGPQNFQKLVVIKKIHDHLAGEREFIEMFQDEARIAALIHHPNVATIFDMGTADDSYYIAMEYVHGHNLAEVMRTAKRVVGTLPWPHAARIVANAAAGLHAAHELRNPDGKPLNVVHRDVSPQNLLISYDGHVKVVDFGIAYAAEKISHTTDGTIKGKIAYMSPEQASSSPLDRRSDVFSLGIVLFEAVCMKRLFKADTDAATLYRVLETVVPPPSSVRPDIPPELEEIMLKALHKDPERRFATAGDLEEALERLLVRQGQMVSHHQIGDMMMRFFEDQRRVKDEQIQQASHAEPEEPMKAYGMAGEVSSLPDGLHTDSLIHQTVQRPAPLTALIGAGLGVALVVVLGALLLTRADEPKQHNEKAKKQAVEHSAALAQRETGKVEEPMAVEPRPRAMKPREKDKQPQQVRVRILVRPDKAKPVVKFRNKKHRGSPFEMQVVMSEEKESVEIAAKGYYTERLKLVPDRDKEVIVHLKPRPRRHNYSRTRRRTGRQRIGAGDLISF